MSNSNDFVQETMTLSAQESMILGHLFQADKAKHAIELLVSTGKLNDTWMKGRERDEFLAKIERMIG